MDQEIARLSQIGQAITLYGREVLFALLILVVGLILSKIVAKRVRKLLERFITKPPLVATVSTSVHLVLVVLVITAALRYAGVETLIIRRVLIGVTLAAVGLIVLLRPYIPTLPYRVGNMVQAGGLLGIVEGTTFLNTRLRTFDGRTVFIPNSKILNDNVINYHYIPNRQFRITVLVHYKDDLLKAKSVIAELLGRGDNPIISCQDKNKASEKQTVTMSPLFGRTTPFGPKAAMGVFGESLTTANPTPNRYQYPI